MARILITSGPTRQYLDPVRFLSNASSGTMGKCLAESALARGHEVVIVSGPVQVTYPSAADVISVMTTTEMKDAAVKAFASCDGMIGAAAPCDYQPLSQSKHKIKKSNEPLTITLIETPDVIAHLGTRKQAGQWTVGFALESDPSRGKAVNKLKKKNCDLVVLNGVAAIDSDSNAIEIINADGESVAACQGPKSEVADVILDTIQERLIAP